MNWKIRTIAPVLALAACADGTAADEAADVSAPPPEKTIAPAPSPAPSPGNGADAGNGGDGGNGGDEDGGAMAWNFGTTAAGPKLAHGVPRTDNVRLMLRCAGGNRIELSFVLSSAGEGPMTVQSGGESETISATAEQIQLGGVSVRAALAAGAAPLQRFRGGSSLSVEYAGETRTVPPAGGQAERFFSAC